MTQELHDEPLRWEEPESEAKPVDEAVRPWRKLKLELTKVYADNRSMQQDLVPLDSRDQPLATLMLMPLAEAAWVDGALEAAEKSAIVKAASALVPDHSAETRRILNHWVEERPRPEALVRRGLLQRSRPGREASVQTTDHGISVRGAEATGGFFSLGNKIPKPERIVIAELEQTMSYTVRMWALPENLGESVRPET